MEITHGAGDAPTINIEGEKVALGPPCREHLPLFARWANDFSISALGMDAIRPFAIESVEADYERVSKGERRGYVAFTIYERDSLRPIGGANLRDFGTEHGTAEYGIFIGDKGCWGRRYGTETTVLMLDFGFTVLNLRNIMLDVMAVNERAIRAYRRAGFREIGRRRQAYRLGNAVHDVLFMDCLASEFKNPGMPVVELQ